MLSKQPIPSAFFFLLVVLAAALPQFASAPQPTPATTDNTETAPTDTATTPSHRVPPPDTQADTIAAVAADANAGQIVWLNDNKGKFLALFERDRSGDPQGAILILHAEGQHLNLNQSTQSLRLALPEWGWATLTIELPDPLLPSVPPRPKPEEIQAEKTPPNDEASPSNEDAADPSTNTAAASAPAPAEQTTEEAPRPEPADPEPIAQARLKAAVNYLHEQGQFNLAMIAIGVNAARGAYFMKQISPAKAEPSDPREKTFQTLVIINPRHQLPTHQSTINPELPESLADPSTPILDIYEDTQINEILAKQRLDQAKRKKITAYRQIALADLDSPDSTSHDRLIRSIRGFLRRHMRGMELPNSKVGQ